MESLIAALSATSSLNDKVALLKQYDSPLVREAMNIALNPYILTNIKKFEKMPTGTKKVSDVWEDFKLLINDLNTHTISGTNAKNAVNHLLSQCNENAQNVLKLILMKDLKVGLGVKLVEKAYGEYIDKFTVQLAEKYRDFLAKGGDSNINHFWATPKLNGHRGFYNGSMLSRTGKPILGFEHIYEELNTLMDECEITFVDGELYSHELQFSEIASIVRTMKPDPRKKQIKYCVFYIGGDWKDTDEMVKRFSECQAKYTFNHITFVPYRMVANNEKDIQDLCVQYSQNGYEGVMLRHPKNHYSWARDFNLIKHKLFVESDFEIIDFKEGEKGSACEGTLGAITIKGKYAKCNVISDCGSGFKLSGEYSRDWFWANRKTLKGAIVEIKFQSLTDKPNPVTAAYSLNFPVFLKIKEPE